MQKPKAIVGLLRKWSKNHMLMAFILATVADLIARALIPGAGWIDLILSIGISLGVFVMAIKASRRTGDSLIESLHRSYSHA